jgi:hypothetical protein
MLASELLSVVGYLSPSALGGDTRLPSIVLPLYRSSPSSVSPHLTWERLYADIAVELTAPNWGAFTAGRVVAYIGVSAYYSLETK